MAATQHGVPEARFLKVRDAGQMSIDELRAAVLDGEARVAAAETQLAGLRAELAEREQGDSLLALSPAAKVRLFRRLFRCRDDVYAVRWESSRSGQSWFAPACRNEWLPGV